MYIKVKSYSLNWNRRSLAIVKMSINPLTFKLKAVITLTNEETHTLYSNGETNDDFERTVEIFIHSKSNLH
jgi:hypothetical protein